MVRNETKRFCEVRLLALTCSWPSQSIAHGIDLVGICQRRGRRLTKDSRPDRIPYKVNSARAQRLAYAHSLSFQFLRHIGL